MPGKSNGNKPIIYMVGNSCGNYKGDRDDLAQEIVTQLLKSYHFFNRKYKFATWRYRVALNEAISF